MFMSMYRHHEPVALAVLCVLCALCGFFNICCQKVRIQPDPCASVSSVASAFYFVLISSGLWYMVVVRDYDERRRF